MTESAVDSSPLLALGQAALQKGAWREALDLFADVLTVAETPEALEGLALAAWWLEDPATTFDKRERAFRLYRLAGDRRSAARVATTLGMDYADLRGEIAVADGWFQRAASLLEGLEPSAEHAWLAVYEGVIALVLKGDAALARQHQQQALEVSRGLGIFDLEMLSLTLDGLILVREGRVAEGMRRMDEATAAAVGGEMTDLNAIGNACCAVIYACEAVADYNRAAQWCDRTKEFCRRWGLSSLFAICRSYYATVLVWRGAWTEAEAELKTAAQELQASRPGNAFEALAKLGDLRRRQGRHAEAQELLAGAEGHPMALLGKAALALDRSDPDSAIDLVRRFLRRITDEDQAEHVFALEISVRAHVIKGDLEHARAAASEAASLAEFVGTPSLQASAALSQGLVCLGNDLLEDAKDRFEDAVDLFEATGNEFDAGRARMDLSRALFELGRAGAAREQAAAALTNFTRLGALFHAELATRLAAGSAAASAPQLRRMPLSGLTPREGEVLWLLVEGKTNQDIADVLVLSVRTVERHISTIYEKLNLHGKAARAAATAFALKHRLGQG